MKLLFDSSAIFEAVRLGSKALDLLKGNFTTTLAYYELGNILWKYEGKLNVEIVFSAMKKSLAFDGGNRSGFGQGGVGRGF